MADIYDDLIVQTATLIKAIDTAVLPADQVYEQKVASASRGTSVDASRLFCLVAPGGNPTELAVSNVQDDITYPILTLVAQPSNQSQTKDRKTFLSILRKIRRKFAFQRRPEITESDVWTCNIQRDPAFNADSFFSGGYDLSAMMLNFVSREFTGQADPDDDGVAT